MPPLLVIAAVYLVVSLLTFVAYGIDKHQAIIGRRRIPERTLHLLELAGGWPGAALGQACFHHKWRKFSYMAVFFGIVVIHVTVWAGCLRMGWLS